MWWSSVASASTFMPPAATAIASQVDQIYAFLLIGSLISFIILIGGMCWFVFKYKRRTENDKTAYITHNTTLEFLWSFIPFCIFIFSFAWGWIVYHRMRTVPENALEVHVVAKKWLWTFLYKNGKVQAGNPAELVVPAGRPVKLIMSSEKINPGPMTAEQKANRKWAEPADIAVLHSFYVPAFRVKQDVVPGRYTMLWFQADIPGEYYAFCAELCGPGHSGMMAKVKVLPNAEFEQWLSAEEGAGGTLADQGKALYQQKACIGCHSLDGKPMTGPTFKGLFGRKEQTSAGEVTVDEDYIRESILNPNAKIVNGYPPAMPPYAGQLDDTQIAAIIEFIKSVK